MTSSGSATRRRERIRPSGSSARAHSAGRWWMPRGADRGALATARSCSEPRLGNSTSSAPALRSPVASGSVTCRPGQLRAVAQAKRDRQVLAGGGLARVKRARRGELAPSGEHEQPRHEHRGQKGERQQVELPRAEDARREVRGGGHDQQCDAPAGGPDDVRLPVPGSPPAACRSPLPPCVRGPWRRTRG